MKPPQHWFPALAPAQARPLNRSWLQHGRGVVTMDGSTQHISPLGFRIHLDIQPVGISCIQLRRPDWSSCLWFLAWEISNSTPWWWKLWLNWWGSLTDFGDLWINPRYLLVNQQLLNWLNLVELVGVHWQLPRKTHANWTSGSLPEEKDVGSDLAG